MKKALIAMSGGVDSSVAALILKNKGYDCVGTMMKLNPQTETGDALKIADRLSIPFFPFDYSKEFSECVITSFVKAYENGETPNPCVECNRCLKFGELFQKMLELDCEYIVTGHYARVTYNEETGEYSLLKARDETKDQSYFLYMLTQEKLRRILFPLGDFTKAEIREIAQENGFVNAHKKDSQDICFIPDGDYGAFIENYANKTFPKGEFIHKSGEKLGEHKGIIHYTVGQRRGLGVAYKNPLYVCNINPQQNTVILGDNDDLFTSTVYANNVNIINSDDLSKPMRVLAKVRYRHIPQPATAVITDDGILKVVFDSPQRAVTKGQSLVMYENDRVVGGGIIIATE